MQITISDELVQQTMQAFHTNNAQIALEKALQSFLQSKTTNSHHASEEVNTQSKNSISDLIGCTHYQGKEKTIEEMDAGIKQAVIEEWNQNDSC